MSQLVAPLSNRVRTPFPEHLPRERVVIPAPAACPCCGGKLAKLGEDVTETLEVVPRQWKVVQTVREKFTCRSCEKITQLPAPFRYHRARRAGASLLAMILYAKYGHHQPLNRQSESFAREGIELDVSTMADWVGACTANLAPLVELIRRHVRGVARLTRHCRADAGGFHPRHRRELAAKAYGSRTGSAPALPRGMPDMAF